MGEHEGIDKFRCWVYKEKDIAAVSWKNKQVVNFLTNIATTQTTTVQQKQHGEDEKTDKQVPVVNQDYSKKEMGHVDTFDAALAHFLDHRNVSWKHTHFLSMLKMSIINA